MKVLIRPMTPEDAADIKILSNQLGYNLSIADTIKQIEAVVNRDDHCAFVAIFNEKLVGWVHAFIAITIESKPFIEIGGIVTDEECRSKGVGSSLVERIKEWSTEKEILSLRVRSNVKRKEAHRFYEKAGFKELKEQKVFALEL